MGKKDQRSSICAGYDEERIHYRKNKYFAPVGGIFIVLAVIGLISVGIFCVNFTRRLLDNTSEKQKFEQVIAPMLMSFDPTPFENPQDADPLFLLQSSLWTMLLSEKRESYPYDEVNRLIVPASDVDVACAQLFGSDVKLQHQSFGDYEINYVYEEETKTYHVPISGQVALYTPSVESVVKKGDLYTLTIGYIPPTNAWTQTVDGKTQKAEADKYMIYELQKKKDHYQLLAIRDVPVEQVGSEAARLGLDVPGASSSTPAGS